MAHTTKTGILRAALGAFFMTTAVGTSARAADEVDRDKAPSAFQEPLIGEASTSVQLNPSILTVTVGARYRHVTSRDERGAERTYLQMGAGLSGTPSFVAPSIHGQARLHPLLTLRAEYSFVAFTSHSRGLMTFGSKDADFGSTELERQSADSGAQQRATLSHLYENKLGPLTMRGRTNFMFLHTSGNEDGHYYVPDQDTLVRDNDVTIGTRTDFFFTPWRGSEATQLQLGPTLQSNWAIRNGIMKQRIGGAIAFTPVAELGPMKKPTIAMDAGVNLQDPNRNHQLFGMVALNSQF